VTLREQCLVVDMEMNTHTHTPTHTHTHTHTHTRTHTLTHTHTHTHLQELFGVPIIIMPRISPTALSVSQRDCWALIRCSRTGVRITHTHAHTHTHIHIH